MSLLKNALLTMFVGKSGRERLKAYSDAQKLGTHPGRLDLPVEEAEAELLPPSSTTPRGPQPMASGAAGTDLDRALQSAKINMARKATKAVKQGPNGERKQLIADALAAHRSKQQMLNELDDETRVKLTMMALTAFMGGDKK